MVESVALSAKPESRDFPAERETCGAPAQALDLPARIRLRQADRTNKGCRAGRKGDSVPAAYRTSFGKKKGQ